MKDSPSLWNRNRHHRHHLHDDDYDDVEDTHYEKYFVVVDIEKDVDVDVDDSSWEDLHVLMQMSMVTLVWSMMV